MMNNKAWLDMADYYANRMSGCRKVTVGSIIVKHGSVIGMGANRAFPDLCKARGCLRVEKYGNNDKTHRGPADCRALHSEIDAICNLNASAHGATIYVTRYPCESCARAIVSVGIKTVVYGRSQEISDEAYRIFEAGHVAVIWVNDWDALDAMN